jgi:muramoyltetrapeptide carboxypeptidase
VLLNGERVTYTNKKDLSPRNALVQIDFRTETITPGKARGRLLGGNLTVLTTILGSPYLPDWQDCIFFCEDVDEELYRIDRMLTQLKLAGVLSKCRGFVFGGCSQCRPGSGNYGALTLEEIFADHIKPLGVPAWSGAMIGHAQPQWTLPEGAEVEIDTAAGTIQLLESPVV